MYTTHDVRLIVWSRTSRSVSVGVVADVQKLLELTRSTPYVCCDETRLPHTQRDRSRSTVTMYCRPIRLPERSERNGHAPARVTSG